MSRTIERPEVTVASARGVRVNSPLSSRGVMSERKLETLRLWVLVLTARRSSPPPELEVALFELGEHGAMGIEQLEPAAGDAVAPCVVQRLQERGLAPVVRA